MGMMISYLETGLAEDVSHCIDTFSGAIMDDTLIEDFFKNLGIVNIVSFYLMSELCGFTPLLCLLEDNIERDK